MIVVLGIEFVLCCVYFLYKVFISTNKVYDDKTTNYYEPVCFDDENTAWNVNKKTYALKRKWTIMNP